MKSSNKIDGEVAVLISEALAASMPDEEARAAATAEVMTKLAPVYGAGAMRRRAASDMRNAFKEGFRIGQGMGRFARWHSAIWSTCRLARSLRENAVGDAAAQSRYSKYNDW